MMPVVTIITSNNTRREEETPKTLVVWGRTRSVAPPFWTFWSPHRGLFTRSLYYSLTVNVTCDARSEHYTPRTFFSFLFLSVCVCMYVCVCTGERERANNRNQTKLYAATNNPLLSPFPFFHHSLSHFFELNISAWIAVGMV